VLVEFLFNNYMIALASLCSVSTKVPELTSICLTELWLFRLVVVAEINLLLIVESFQKFFAIVLERADSRRFYPCPDHLNDLILALFFVAASCNKFPFNSLNGMPFAELEFDWYKLLNTLTNNYLSGFKEIRWILRKCFVCWCNPF
jgi:hypothetical protein